MGIASEEPNLHETGRTIPQQEHMAIANNGNGIKQPQVLLEARLPYPSGIKQMP